MKKNQFFLVTFFFSLIFSLFFPEIGKNFWPHIFPLLFVLMFFSSLEISFPVLRKTAVDLKFLGINLGLIFVLSPLLAFTLSYPFLDSLLVAALVIASSTPAGIVNVAFSKWINGQLEENMAITLISHIFSVFFLPGITFIMLGKIFSINFGDLFLKLFLLIFIPLLLVKFLRSFLRKKDRVWRNIKNPLFTLAPFFFILWGIFSRTLSYLNWSLVKLFLLVFCITAILFFVGFKSSQRIGKDSRSGALSAGRRNLSLAYMVAFALNEPLFALPAVMWSLFQNILPSIIIIKER